LSGEVGEAATAAVVPVALKLVLDIVALGLRTENEGKERLGTDEGDEEAWDAMSTKT
jgi:hypothetical protein